MHYLLVVRDQNSLQCSPKNSECLVSLVVEEVQDSIQYLVHLSLQGEWFYTMKGVHQVRKLVLLNNSSRCKEVGKKHQRSSLSQSLDLIHTKVFRSLFQIRDVVDN